MSEARGPYEARTREQVGRELIATLVWREKQLLIYTASIMGAVFLWIRQHDVEHGAGE